ncbi:stage II sporulation protein M [Bacillus toyonensis]|uniref:stage II sporulation protein M n=1 Tax=Bacillus toyonensis TaxID=155322 RepID=UPI000BFDE4E8|nr:stage II sporulation protein M [Bacillus toyonensis]PHG57718.1 hypothetical protein COI59_29340 [Bacillus toyonensis]
MNRGFWTFFLVSFIIFGIAMLLGLIFGYYIDFQMEYSKQNSSLNTIDGFYDILFNNLKVFFIILLGTFIWKIPSVLNLVYNGGILGLVFYGLYRDGLLYLSLAPILAHGVLEITAFLLGASIAFGGCEFIKNHKRVTALLLLFSVVLLVAAAYIETFISILLF